jgi:phage terminase large subunit GpA-like protein
MWSVNVDVFKTDLAQRFRASPDKPGAWYVTADCLEQGQFYLKQVVNEPQVMVRGKDGRYKVAWRERDSTIHHDYWDCEVYASIGAQMIVDSFPGGGWDAATWPKPERKQRRQRVSAAQIGER